MSEYKFGELVKARLAELKMSQNALAKRVLKGRSYINYVVTGENRTAKNKQSKPGPDAVETIARALGIPVDEALTAAGWPQYIGRQRTAVDAPVVHTPENRTAVGQFNKAGQANEIAIELGDDAQIIFRHSGRRLTKSEIARYTLAFQTAFEVVRQQSKAKNTWQR
jgi:transcriptional regulator with XRE-family HTH domain